MDYIYCIIIWDYTMSSIHGFRLLNSLIDILLTFEFGRETKILKVAISHNINYFKIEPALNCLKNQHNIGIPVG